MIKHMRVLITEKFHPILFQKFSEFGLQFDVFEDIDTQGVHQIIANYEILIVNSKIKVDEILLQKAKKLKAIGRVGSGMEIIDLDYCKANQIFVCSAPEGNRNAVAEQVLGFLLSSFQNLSKAQASLLNGNWDREVHRGFELNGKTIGLVGFGNTGQQLAKLLSGFDLEVLAYDKQPIKTDIKNVKIVSLDDIYKNADIVSLHLPLNSETLHFANAHFFNSFHKNIWFVNTSRGKVCNTLDLITAIKNGKIHAAMLDVFEEEPLKINEDIKRLCQSNKMFITPHIAGWTFESYERLARMIADKIINYLKN
jgi:D-3-phosphoglycerate dehydrogenase